ncbi:MAG: hypothetical protein ACK5IM_03520, partial [Demequina sp.]|uniref:hypothetical protein n=1 Tax=Demequina sp. TaxID=2050685 RepID=UPI003A8B87E7
AVNLIPQEIAEATKLRAIKMTALFAVLIAVGVMVGAYVLALGAKQLAKNGLDDAITDQTTAIAERDAQKTVFDDLSTYESQAWTLGQIGYGDIAVQDLVSSVLNAAEDGTTFEKVVYFGPTATGSGMRNNSDTAIPGMGTIEFKGWTESYETTTALAAAVEALPGLEQVLVTSETYTDGTGSVVWEFNGTATVTMSALTGRFIDDGSTVEVDPESLDAEETAPAPLPSLSPSPAATEED